MPVLTNDRNEEIFPGVAGVNPFDLMRGTYEILGADRDGRLRSHDGGLLGVVFHTTP